MPTLAPKLPWQHPFAGVYPRRGGQPLPTDPDAIDYLNRVAAADGAAVEVGIAQAIDAFVRGCKADGTWSAIQASCIMCGARTLSGALVPLKGTAPTPYNFASGDYSRSGTPGLKGDGTTKYIDTNRANNADGQDDVHLAVYKSSVGDSTSGWSAGSRDRTTAPVSHILVGSGGFYNRSNAAVVSIDTSSTTGLRATSRESSSSAIAYYNGTSTTASVASVPVAASANHFVFAFGTPNGTAVGHSNARLAFYSVGSSLSLSALDARVSTLVSQIAAAIP